MVSALSIVADALRIQGVRGRMDNMHSYLVPAATVLLTCHDRTRRVHLVRRRHLRHVLSEQLNHTLSRR
jgi:hypothetical protein